MILLVGFGENNCAT